MSDLRESAAPRAIQQGVGACRCSHLLSFMDIEVPAPFLLFPAVLLWVAPSLLLGRYSAPLLICSPSSLCRTTS